MRIQETRRWLLMLVIGCFCQLLGPHGNARSAGTDGFSGEEIHGELTELRIAPDRIHLRSARDQQRIVVTAHYADGSSRDVTAECEVDVGQSTLVQYLDETLLPTHDGEGQIIVQYGGLAAIARLDVLNSSQQPPIEFRNEVLQILTKTGCNTGKCHGAGSGKDGFRLSLFGYDPAGDHLRITREQNGRRIHWNHPEQSLLMLKATGNVAHTGGGPIAENSADYRMLLQWIAEGAPSDSEQSRIVESIEVFPKEVVFSKPSGLQKLVVLAHYSDGSQQDVTARSVFLSNNDAAASVDSDGMVQANGRGASFVLARFDQSSSGASILVRPGTPFSFPEVPVLGEIDRRIDERLRYLHISPSELASDEIFLRRSSIDLVGLLPTEEEFKAFLKDSSPDKGSRWVESLMERSEFQDQWILHWAELLQIRTNNGVSQKALLRYDQWLRDAVHRGMTIDKIVRDLLPASGGTLENPATNYFQTETTPQLMAENVAQVFLGTRIQCAQCHNHPFDRWTMNDYYDFAAFFSQIGYKQGEDPRELTIFNSAQGEIIHPLGKKGIAPRFLGTATPAETEGRDYRDVLAEELASLDNRAFARNIANVVWAHFFGVGIVDPVDDVRISNPPSNDSLLDYLADRLIEEKYNLAPIVREICNSRAYQAQTARNPSNALDERFYSHQKIRRMRAEVLLDCVCQVTESSERLPGLPVGSRAVQIADGAAANYFLTTFGRSNRNLACTCETKVAPTLSQALHLLNGETTTGKIAQGGIIAQWLKEELSPEDIAQRLTIRSLSRKPTTEEMRSLSDSLRAGAKPAQALEDYFWALLNSNEFIFNH